MNYFELFQESPSLFFLFLVISLVVTLFAYGAYPIIFAKTRKTPISKKKYKILCYCVNIIGIIFFISLNGSPISGGPYILWTWIFSDRGLKILTAKRLLIDATQIEETSNIKPDYRGLSEINADDYLNVISKIHAEATIDAINANVTGQPNNEKNEEFGFLPENPNTTTVAAMVDHQKLATTKRYCTYCGSLINEETKTCTGCGKRYFKGIKHFWGKIFCKQHLALIIVSFVLLLSLIVNIVFAVNVADLDRAYQINQAKVENYEDLMEDYKNEIDGLENDLFFYDKHVVFVSDDGTKLYHKIDCYKFDSSYFWAYNTEYAAYLGYTPCGWCCD